MAAQARLNFGEVEPPGHQDTRYCPIGNVLALQRVGSTVRIGAGPDREKVGNAVHQIAAQ
jgi:hypothetical protein